MRNSGGRGGLRELSVLATLYAGYVVARLGAEDDLELARGRALFLLDIERRLYLDVEAATNALVSQAAVLAVPASYWYAALHYVVTPAVLVWLYVRREEIYTRARTALVSASVVGLAGFIAFPTAPPRLIGGYVDTLARYADSGWWSSHASAPRGLGHLTNELAAMPSLHVGWAIWVAWAVRLAGAPRAGRRLAVGYATGTAVVVVVTGNHWLLDVVAGAAVAVVGFVVSSRHSWAPLPLPEGGQLHLDRRHPYGGLDALLATGSGGERPQRPGPWRREEAEVAGRTRHHLGGELAVRIEKANVGLGYGRAVAKHLTGDHGLLGDVDAAEAAALHRGSTHGQVPFQCRAVPGPVSR